MASLVLMSMMTFVLCTGLGQGGLEDRLLKFFGRNQGAVLAKLNGRELHANELHDLKMQRNVANDFMRKFCDNLIRATSEAAKHDVDKAQDEKTRGQRQMQAAQLRLEF